MGQGVIRRMNSARAREHGTEFGQPPDRHSRIAQSIGYVCARAEVVAPKSSNASENNSEKEVVRSERNMMVVLVKDGEGRRLPKI